MTYLLTLLDSSDLPHQLFLERCLSGLGFECETINANNIGSTPTIFAKKCLEADVFLIQITSKDSLCWHIANQISESKEGANKPIVAMLNFSADVVGKNYEIWKQHQLIFSTSVKIPIDLVELEYELSNIFNNSFERSYASPQSIKHKNRQSLADIIGQKLPLTSPQKLDPFSVSRKRLPQIVKIAIIGEPFSRKTDFIKTVSEIGLLTFDLTYAPASSSNEVTWGIDFGHIKINRNLTLGLFAAPPDARQFDLQPFNQYPLSQDLLGFVVLVNRAESWSTRSILENLQANTPIPYILAVDSQVFSDVLEIQNLRSILPIEAHIKVTPCRIDARESIITVLLELLSIVEPNDISNQLIQKLKMI